MSLIELAFAGLNVGAGLTCGYYGYREYGVVGAVVGGIGAPVGLILLVEGIGRLGVAWHRRKPVNPICKNGICQSDDYRCVDLWNHHLKYQCKCGTTYVAKGRQFLEVLPDGTLKPFMRKRRFGDWEPDA